MFSSVSILRVLMGHLFSRLFPLCLLTGVATLSAAPPAAPSGFRASMTFPLSSPNPGTEANPAFHTYLFQWTDNSTDETGFELLARLGTSGTFSSLGTITPNSILATTTLAVFPAKTTLQFRLRSFKGTPRENSTLSNIATVVIPANPDFDPPADLTATPLPGGHMRLNWKDLSEQEEHYVIETRETGAGEDAWEFYSLPNFNITSLVVGDDLDPGEVRDFRVLGLRIDPGTTLAVDPATKRLAHRTGTAGSYTYSLAPLKYTAPAVVGDVTIPPLASPSPLYGEVVNETTIRLRWIDDSAREQGYKIEYRAATNQPSGDFTFLEFAAPNDTSMEINTPPGRALEWVVSTAIERSDGSGDIYAPSNPVTVTTPFHAPTGLAVSSSPDHDVLTFTWTDNSLAESGFELLGRVAGSGSFVSVKTVAAGTTTTTFTGLSPAASFEFAVRATHSSGSVSPPSNFVTATTRSLVTSRSYQAITPGQPFSYQATTTSAINRTGWQATGLPAGLTLDPVTGLISGIATEYGVFPVSLRAAFGDGTVVDSVLTLRSVRPPSPPVVSQSGTRAVAPGTELAVPLSSLFTDPDTEQAVRMNTTLGPVDIVLYPSATPLTVANFMAYVNAADYDGVAFHRAYASGPIDIVQGGAFKPAPLQGPESYIRVPARPPVLNESGISNRVGTIAMAKLSGDPNSATHDFFFNRTDSHDPTDPNALDNQNGGFTVFGRVAGQGMQIVDAISALPRGNYYILPDGSGTPIGPFAGWPINDISAPGTMNNDLNILANSVTPVEPLAFEITGNTNAGEVSATLTGPNLVISGQNAGQSTEITIAATDLDGNTVSQTFMARIDDAYEAPMIGTGPQPQSVPLGESAIFTVEATGSADLTYRWLMNGEPITGATGDTLTIPEAGYPDQGSYTVAVTNEAGTVTSAAATLTVTGPPVITVPPANVSRTDGYPATFSVAATGPGPFSHQWLKGNTELPGKDGPTLSLPSITPGDAGEYRVRVSNTHGATTSAPANLTVLPRGGDSDGDGYDDAAEFAFGTDHLLASSRPTGFFVARTDGPVALRDLLWRRVAGTTTPYIHSLNGTPTGIPAFWLGTHELTNRQFAALLRHAHEVLGITEIATLPGGQRAIRYQGEIVCNLATHRSTDPGHNGVNEIDHHPTAGFFVPAAVADHPARGITWHGAYLASVAFNAFSAYPGKNEPATWAFAPDPDGGHLPPDVAWEWAARSGAANRAFPTGASVTAALANFNRPAGSPRRVGSFPANAFGIFDLGGNVAEWVADGPDDTNAFLRGGSWSDPAPALSNLSRATRPKAEIASDQGVRLALKDDRPPAFATPPISRIVTRDQPLVFDAAASGAPGITAQWFKNNVAIKGRTAMALTIPAPKLTDAGIYRLDLRNALGVLRGDNVAAAVVDLPSIPQERFVKEGVPVVFRVPYAGAGLAFAWHKDGSPLADGTAHRIVSPATASGVATLTIPAPTRGSSGRYTCTVSSGFGQSVIVTFDLAVAVEPILRLAAPPTTILNESFTYDPVFDGHPLRRPTRFTATGLPRGLTINSATGRISGRPLGSGTFRVTIVASNPAGSSTASIQLNVQSLNPNTIGSFVALIDRDGLLNGDLGGRLDLTTTAAGAYSVVLRLGPATHRFSGILAATITPGTGAMIGGNATLQKDITRPGRPALRLDISVDADSRLVTGTVRELVTPATPAAAVNGWRNVWSAKNFPPSSRLGRHNFALDIPGALHDSATIPQGFGHGSFQIPASGAVTATGLLSDGSPFTSAAPLGPNGEILLYQLLHRDTGSFHGTLSVEGNANHTVSGSPTWRKASKATDPLYPSGFGLNPAEPFTLIAVGGLYLPPAAGQFVLGLPPLVPPAISEFVQLRFNGGGIPNPADRLNVPAIQIRPIAAVTMPPTGQDNPASATLKITPNTGSFSGTIRLVDGPAVRIEKFQGLIVRDDDGKLRGYGYFLLTELPLTNSSPRLSGGVVLEETP